MDISILHWVTLSSPPLRSLPLSPFYHSTIFGVKKTSERARVSGGRERCIPSPASKGARARFPARFTTSDQSLKGNGDK